MPAGRRWGSGLAILLVNYGSHELLAANVALTIDADFDGEVVVLDNFSSDAERAAMLEISDAAGWICVCAPTNVGFGGGMNLAADAALRRGAVTLLLLNPDASLPPGSARALHERARANPLAVVAPIILRPDGRVFAEATDLDLDSGESRARSRRAAGADIHRLQPWVSGACFAVSAELWRRIGGFDEEYFLYWEDVDLCARARAQGAEIVVDETAVAVHDPGGTQKHAGPERVKSPVYYYYNTRNRLLFAAKHLRAADQRRWRRNAIGASYRILLRGGRRQFVHPARSLLPAARGLRDGLRLMKRGGNGAS